MPPDARDKISGMNDIAKLDNEAINAIGTLLADLQARTKQLRGYL